MLAKPKPKRTVTGPRQYNEDKVALGKAAFIGSGNFLKDHHQLTGADITQRFLQRTSLNERAVKKAVHISLNLGTREQLDNGTLMTVADRYMESIGFGDQPYIVYRHFDAGHTHLHIVTTSIRADGSPIHISLPDLDRSRKVCEALEEEFSLQHNIREGPKDEREFKVRHAQAVSHGEPGFKRAVSNVLNTVIDHYNYTSLDELNAVLREYNVAANAGTENSHLRRMGGLLYHGLDEEGNKIGVPLKASKFAFKPTLKHLQERFAINRSLRESPRDRLLTSIEWSLAGRTPDWARFQESLRREEISMVITGSKQGSSERLYFVDHQEKSVFLSDSLGSKYSLGALRERCSPTESLVQNQMETQKQHLKL